ncbi:MAG: hypothetical protein Q8938_11695 [Bacteroidota bacterium]|nr:hypothetical protein [Bacteroidota bacterium]
MSAWRQKAIDCAPEFKKEFEQPETSIYDVFMDLRSVLVDAHRTNNVDRLRKIYDFAEWCFGQNTSDLWNAAGVSFYEHLADSEETLKAMPRWVKQDIYRKIRGLLQFRISDEKMKGLDNLYGIKE